MKTRIKIFLDNIPIIGKIIISIWRKFRSVKRLYEERNFVNALSSKNSNQIKIVIGSSRKFQEGWIPTDREYLDILNNNHWKKYFKENSIDAILSEHVLEHLTLKEGELAASIFFSYLKKGGYIRLAVPDGFNPDEAYIKYQDVGGNFSDKDGHKILYNYKLLSSVFEAAGFKVTLLEYFDEDGVLHLNHWDPKKGKIHRSSKFDNRFDPENPIWTSLIMDAIKE